MLHWKSTCVQGCIKTVKTLKRQCVMGVNAKPYRFKWCKFENTKTSIKGLERLTICQTGIRVVCGLATWIKKQCLIYISFDFWHCSLLQCFYCGNSYCIDVAKNDAPSVTQSFAAKKLQVTKQSAECGG